MGLEPWNSRLQGECHDHYSTETCDASASRIVIDYQNCTYIIEKYCVFLLAIPMVILK